MRIVTNALAVNEMKTSVVKEDSPPQENLAGYKAKPQHKNEREMERAKSRFAAAVSSTLSDLMFEKGYCRERATALLLNSIRDKNEAPTDCKIISFMNKYGIGYDEASHVLIVSEAVRSSCSRRNISPEQAVDDLISKLTTLSSANVGIAPETTFKTNPSSVTSETIGSKDGILPSSTSSNTLVSLGSNKIRHSKRRKSVRKNSSNTINISSNHSQKNKKSCINTACPYQSYNIQDKDLASPSQDFGVNVCERNGMGKKTKKNNVCKSTKDSHNGTSLSIKSKSSTSACAKRKRERERTQQHVNSAEAVLAEGTPSKKLRRSPTV